MDPLFKQLYYGNYTAGVEVNITNSEYRSLIALYSKKCDEFSKLLAELNSDLKAQFDNFTSLEHDIHTLEREEMFRYGLSLGLLLMAEALQFNLN